MQCMLKKRRPVGRLFFHMGLPILVRWYLYIGTGPMLQTQNDDKIDDNFYGFSNMAFDWLAALLAAKQWAGLKIDDARRTSIDINN